MPLPVICVSGRGCFGAVQYCQRKNAAGCRSLAKDENNEVYVKESYDYYPFGKILPGRSLVSGEQPATFKYTGKELDDENALEWYYFGARYYDAEIGRFWVVDPKANKTPYLSPYVYCHNNPINRYDPDGMEDKKAAANALKRLAGASLGYAGGWTAQGIAIAASGGSAGTLTPLGVMTILAAEAGKTWSLVEFGIAINDFQLAMQVPDGTDAEALGNLAYEVAQAHGISDSKSEIVGLVADVIANASSLTTAHISLKTIDLIKLILATDTLTGDVRKLFEKTIEENNSLQNPNQNNSNNDNDDSGDTEDDDDDKNNDSWFSGWGAEHRSSPR